MEDDDLGIGVEVVLLEKRGKLFRRFLGEDVRGRLRLEDRAQKEPHRHHGRRFGGGTDFVLHLGEHAVEDAAGIVDERRVGETEFVEDFLSHGVKLRRELTREKLLEAPFKNVAVRSRRVARQTVNDVGEFAALCCEGFGSSHGITLLF